MIRCWAAMLGLLLATQRSCSTPTCPSWRVGSRRRDERSARPRGWKWIRCANEVYVDDMEADFGRMIMCHMIADSRTELLQMAGRIGVAARWIQYPHTYREHFDICKTKRGSAIRQGAVPISRKDLAAKVNE